MTLGENQVAVLSDRRGGAHIVTSHGNIHPIEGAMPLGGVALSLDVPNHPENTIAHAHRNGDGSISMHAINGKSYRVG